MSYAQNILCYSNLYAHEKYIIHFLKALKYGHRFNREIYDDILNTIINPNTLSNDEIFTILATMTPFYEPNNESQIDAMWESFNILPTNLRKKVYGFMIRLLGGSLLNKLENTFNLRLETYSLDNIQVKFYAFLKFIYVPIVIVMDMSPKATSSQSFNHFPTITTEQFAIINCKCIDTRKTKKFKVYSIKPKYYSWCRKNFHIKKHIDQLMFTTPTPSIHNSTVQMIELILFLLDSEFNPINVLMDSDSNAINQQLQYYEVSHKYAINESSQSLHYIGHSVQEIQQPAIHINSTNEITNNVARETLLNLINNQN